MAEDIDKTLLYMPVYDDRTIKTLENEFSRLKEECYLDHAGATLYSNTQINNVSTDLCNSFYANPHSVGAASSATQDIIERMRYGILHHFHTSSEEYSVIFTSGATASLKLIADTFQFNENVDNSQVGHFVHTQDVHTSVLGMREVVAERGAKVTCLNHEKAFQIFNCPPKLLNTGTKQNGNSLFVYPAQCNFSGLKYPLKWIKDVHNGILNEIFSMTLPTKWYVFLDAAAFVPTNSLDLSKYKPDFVCLSFYKMFGYPTGIGALLVKNSSADILQKLYYGGGTVDVSLSTEMFHVKRKSLYQRFEDGTVPFLSIVLLKYGFDILSNITMDKISMHVFSLAKYLYHSLLQLHHSNNKPVTKLYTDTVYDSCDLQGGIVTFNLMRSNGEYVGYMEVLNMAALFKINLRVGCFCNPGACQRHLALTNKEILENYDAGYTCGGAADLINGKPTGAVRVSFGYMSTIKDVHTLLLMIRECFLDGTSIKRIPLWWKDNKIALQKKYNLHNTVKNIANNTINIDTTISNNLQNEKKSLNHIFNEMRLFKLDIDFNNSKKEYFLEQLYIYPIKSCAAYEVSESWSLNARGLQYDREWMIVSSTGTCVTQKQQINLCLLKPIICKEQKIMKLTYPGMPPMEMPLEYNTTEKTEATLCQSRVCGHKVQGMDCGSEISEWLSLALGRPNLRLIRQHTTEHKITDKPELSFSSQAQYLVINKSSIQWLTDKITDREFKRNTMIHRFRGNMIINGCEPFEETKWKHIRIGNINFTVNGPCTRCQMICIDQTTGLKTVEPLRTLAEQLHGKLKFGIYLTKESKASAIINISDPVYVT